MVTIAITGAGGYIGQRLIENLDRQNWCHSILGIDIVAPQVKSEKLVFTKTDIRDPQLIDFLKGHEIDTLVHLAFIVDPMHNESEMYDINEQVNCVKREISMREIVYQRRVESGALTQQKADYEIGAMKAVLETLLEVAKNKPFELE